MNDSAENWNPFAEEAAVRAATEVLRELEWKRQTALWEAHLEACRVIVERGILPRLEYAAEAVREWGSDAAVTGVARTETHAGTTHFRAKIVIHAGPCEVSRLEFIASPKSMVIAAEASNPHENKRWQKIALTGEGISGHCDEIIREFLTWGWIKRGNL